MVHDPGPGRLSVDAERRRYVPIGECTLDNLRRTAEALISHRGVSTITAMTILAELGGLTRFNSPRELVGFLGLPSGEYSSGSRRR